MFSFSSEQRGVRGQGGRLPTFSSNFLTVRVTLWDGGHGRKDIVLGAVGADDESLSIDLQRRILQGKPVHMGEQTETDHHFASSWGVALKRN